MYHLCQRRKDLPKRHWVAHRQSLLTQDTDVPPPCAPLMVEQEGKRLVARFMTEQSGDQHLVLLEEERLTPSARGLESLGLTRRALALRKHARTKPSRPG